MRESRIGSRASIWVVTLASALLVGASAWGQESGSSAGERSGEAVGTAPSGGGVQSAQATHRTYSGHRTYVRHRPYRPYAGSRYGSYWGWSPYWGASWGGYWGSYWDPYWYGPRYGYGTVYPRGGGNYGALDTDVSPERAEIWVDGRKIGVADDFDGFPSYLWLEKGTYDVVIYLPGFKTISRQYSIYPGVVIDVEDRMEPGEAVHPLDLGPTSHERRDERLRRDEERRAPPAPGWKSETAPERSAEWLDVRSEPGRLRLAIEPADASVYLDGRFVGTGAELGRLRAGLLVDSGVHTLEVVRPGYLSLRREVDVEQGDQTEVQLELEPAAAELP
jgi:hypothetical protein